MGKGKKKGGGPTKESVKEVEDLQSLTISDAPSTSEAGPSELPSEEVEEGLTGAAKRKKKKEQKKAEKDARKEAAAATTQTASAETASAVTSEPSSEREITPKPQETPKPEPPQPEEEEGGLGLGGSKKRHPRKKKGGDAAKTAASTTAPVPTPAGPINLQPPVLAPAQPLSAPAKPMQPPAMTMQAPPQQMQAPSHPPFVSPAPSTGPGAPWSRPSSTTSTVSSSSVPPWSGQTSPAEAGPSARPAPGQWTRRPAESTPSGDYPSGPSRQQTGAPYSAPQSGPTYAQMRSEPTPISSEIVQPRPGKSEISCRFRVPKKIEGNTVPCKRIQVLTNYLPMTIKQLKVFRYDVSFKPDRPKKLLGKAFNISKNMHFPKSLIAFDQIKNCYSLTELKGVSQNDRFVTNVELLDPNGRTMNFEVSYKGTGVVDLGTITNYMRTGGTSLSPPTEAIQCIDVILRQGTLESYVKAGRQFFKRPAKPVDLGDGLEMWTGLFQSGIFTSRAFVNIDVAHKGFPKQQSLVAALQHDFRLDTSRALENQRGRGIENFHTFIKGLRVVAKVGGDSTSKGIRREFICNGIVGPADKETFCYENPNGKKEMLTVTQYFLRVKGLRLQYPNLNCVWVGPREKTIFYPMELLEVAYGQAQNKQLNETQLATMVRQAATPPDERKRKIEEVIANMNYSKNDYFKKFGLEISDQFFPVEARILKPPTLDVGDGPPVMPKRGVWQSNKVYRPEALQSWGFIAVEADPNRCDFEGTISMVMKVGRSMGMNVSEPAMKRFDVNIRSLQNVLFTALEKNVRFLFVVVSARGRDYYHRVKQMAEREVGILTQCIKEFTAINRMNMQTVRNILLKVNSKLMGINQVLSVSCLPRCLRDGGVMVVGADVTHPSPDQSNIPSIAAVTASIDPKCFLYNIELSIQTPKKEMIVEFEDMMVEHLKVYRNHQRALPKKIFVFRDGVSEGQFAQVMNSELQAVHNAYRTLGGPNAKPEVLFLLVQKRHHTRLFVPNSSQNVEPGTVVDKHIVHASELDFYLVSHHAIKGTARPTRYHAVCNDGDIPHDEVEQLTYYLCHLYARCTRAVSYPTPTYYAHLACLRARSLTHGEKFDNNELERRPKRLRVMDKILQYSRMFFV